MSMLDGEHRVVPSTKADIVSIADARAAMTAKAGGSRKKAAVAAPSEAAPVSAERKSVRGKGRVRVETQPKPGTKSKSKGFSYEGLDLDAETIGMLKQAEAEMHKFGRMETEQVYGYGKVLQALSDKVTDETLSAWAVAKCGMTARHVRNYRNVAANLGRWKDRAVAAGVKATVLFELSSAEPDQIEQVVAEIETTGRLKVSEVKARLGRVKEVGEADAEAALDKGGPSGLKAAAKARADADAATVFRLLHVIRDDVGLALATTPQKRRIEKASLAKKIEAPTRLAKALLEGLLASSKPSDRDPSYIWPVPVPAETGWGKVLAMLYKLGGKDSWPASGDVRSWLEVEVMTSIAWATTAEGKAKPEVVSN